MPLPSLFKSVERKELKPRKKLRLLKLTLTKLRPRKLRLKKNPKEMQHRFLKLSPLPNRRKRANELQDRDS